MLCTQVSVNKKCVACVMNEWQEVFLLTGHTCRLWLQWLLWWRQSASAGTPHSTDYPGLPLVFVSPTHTLSQFLHQAFLFCFCPSPCLSLQELTHGLPSIPVPSAVGRQLKIKCGFVNACWNRQNQDLGTSSAPEHYNNHNNLHSKFRGALWQRVDQSELINIPVVNTLT